MTETIKPKFTVRQTLELARLCYQFRDFPIIGGCYEKLLESLEEQATPEAVKSATSPEHIYFDEYVHVD